MCNVHTCLCAFVKCTWRWSGFEAVKILRVPLRLFASCTGNVFSPPLYAPLPWQHRSVVPVLVPRKEREINRLFLFFKKEKKGEKGGSCSWAAHAVLFLLLFLLLVWEWSGVLRTVIEHLENEWRNRSKSCVEGKDEWLRGERRCRAGVDATASGGAHFPPTAPAPPPSAPRQPWNKPPSRVRAFIIRLQLQLCLWLLHWRLHVYRAVMCGYANDNFRTILIQNLIQFQSNIRGGI